MKTNGWIRRSLAVLCLGTFCATAPLAAGYPDKPVRIVVGFAPGGPTDLAARLIAKHLGEDLGQTFVVENRPGAGGNIATNEAARAAPDGYTGLVAGINLTINPWMTDDLKADTRKDFRPVRVVAIAPTVLVVRNDFPAATFQEFLAQVKANSGKFNSAAPGSSPLLAAILFSQQAGADVVPVPYKGAAPAMVDLMAGHVDLSFATLGSVLPHIKSGKVRALALAAPQRDEQMPDVPTFAELGMPDFRFDAWAGLVVPAGTPDAVVDVLARSLDKLAASPEFAAQALDLGMKPVVDGSPAAFGRIIADELALYEPLAKSARQALAKQ